MKRRSGSLAAVVVALGLLAPLGVPAAGAGVQPSFACQLLHDSGRNPFAVVAGDWNHDGRMDVAVDYTETGTLSVFLNQGERSFRARPEVHIGEVARGIAVADLDGDGDLDLAVTSAGVHLTMLLDNDGTGTFSAKRKLIGGRFPFAAAAADLDGDGRQDVVVVNETNNPRVEEPGTVAVFFNAAAEKPTPPLMLHADQYPSDVQVIDVDGQHGPDLLVTNWGSGTLSVLLNNGDRTFAPATQIKYGGQVPYSLYAADFNGDGKIDLALTDVASSVVWILDGDGHGGFVTRRKLPTGQGVRSVTGGDLNGDGHLDLFTADTASGTVSVLLGKAGGDFADAISIPVGPQPRMVMARDLDGDGRLDLAVTLLGSNDVALLFQTAGESRPCGPAPTIAPPASRD